MAMQGSLSLIHDLGLIPAQEGASAASRKVRAAEKAMVINTRAHSAETEEVEGHTH